MDISEDQKHIIKGWAAEGCALAEIQRRLRDEFGMAMTYMDVRFLLLDLGIDLQDRPEKTKEQNQAPQPDQSADAGATGQGALDAESLAAGGVSVTVDSVVRPGALASGTVRFSNGVNATWMLDQLGRLALDGPSPDYRPSQEDLQQFQQELARVLQQRGF